MTETYCEFIQNSNIHNPGNMGPEATQQLIKVYEDGRVANVTTITNSNPVQMDKVYNQEKICTKLSNSNCEEEQSPLQDRWMKFDTFLQKFYRTILDGKKPPDEFDFYVDIVKELVSNDPHQLFARLEVNLQEFVIEIKLRQLELLDCVHSDEGPHLFVFCLIEGYNKLMFAAYTLSPLLLHLEVEHLARFNLSWRGLNQHLFHTWVFIDPKIQQVLPLCVSKLGKSNCDLPDFNKRLIRQFLSFDDEMTKVGGKWREAESAVIKYHQENSMLNAKWRMTKVNWDLIRNQTRIFHEELKSSGIPTCIDFDVTNEYNSEMSSTDYCTENILENGKKSSQKNIHGNCTSTDSFKRNKGNPDSPQNQQVCECCQTEATDYLSCASLLDPELLLDRKSLKNCTHASYNLGYKDSDILGHLNPDGKKMYSHLHKFKIQQMSNGTRIKRSTSLSIALRDISTTDGQSRIEMISTDQQESPPSAESQRLLTRQQIIQQQRQQHQKKLMQVMQWYEQQDFQHKVQKQLQERHLLLQQHRKMDELHAHLLWDQEMQKNSNLQVQQRLQKHKQVEEKFKVQYIHQLEDKQSICNAASCDRLKQTLLGPKTNHNSSESLNSDSTSSSPLNVTSSSSSSKSSETTTITTTTTSANSNNANMISSSATVTRKNSTTQTASAVNVHPVITNDKRAHQHPLPDVVKSAAAYVCPKHSNDADHSYCSDISSEDEFDWDTPDSPQRHCDCCYCEVFGSTPVSRNFQETRERLRLILTKKKAKSIANNEKSAQQNGSDGSTCASVSQSASQGSNKTKKEANDKVSNAPTEYKGDKSIEEILDFIEGNKNTNMKRAAKKMRRRQRQLEEEERRRKEEEAENLRREELRRKEEEEKRRLEEEKRKQELLRKQGRKKGKKGGKQSKQQSVGMKTFANQPHFSNKKNKNEKNASPGFNDNTGRENAQKQSVNKNLGNQKSTNQSRQLKPGGTMMQNTKKQKDQEPQSKQTENQKNVKNKKDPRQLAATSSNKGLQKKDVTQTQNRMQKNDKSEEKSGQPQMVTIKRVMQPNGNEPTVTITLRGATPKEDKVLYTLHNGQMCQVKDDKQKKQNITAANTRNAKRSVKLISALSNNIPTYSLSNNLMSAPLLPPPSVPLRQMTRTYTKNGDVSNNGVNIITERIERLKLGPQPVPIETSNKKMVSMTAPQAELTTPTAIQINQAVNQLSRASFPNNFDLENIKLPPGITITKVDPSTCQRKPIQVEQQPPPPPLLPPVPQGQLRQAMMPPVVCPSNVIVVDTGDKTDEQIANGKKRRRRRKNGYEPNEEMKNMITNPSYPLTNGLPPRFNPIGTGLYGNTFMNAAAGFGGAIQQQQQQQPAIIQMNGSMVTIRNPALHQSSFLAQRGGEQQITFRNPNINGTMRSPPEEVLNGDIDEYERELEAFKQFCSQSVPAESKAKVNLNIEDIVLKKKGPSVIGCS